MKPVYPRTNSGIRTIEGPMIEGDIDLEVEYPTRRDPQTTTPKKVTIYFKMKEKQEDGTIEYKRELTRDVYFPRYKKKEQR